MRLFIMQPLILITLLQQEKMNLISHLALQGSMLSFIMAATSKHAGLFTEMEDSDALKLQSDR